MPIYQSSAPDIFSHLWGDGFMSPGGERNRAKLLGDRDIKGKRLLDIGCGGGGPGLKLVEERGVELAADETMSCVAEVSGNMSAIQTEYLRPGGVKL